MTTDNSITQGLLAGGGGAQNDLLSQLLQQRTQKLVDQSNQPKKPFIETPEFGQAMFNLSATLAAAKEQGLSLGSGVALGLQGFGEDMTAAEKARKDAVENSLADLSDIVTLQLGVERLEISRAERKHVESQAGALREIVEDRPELAPIAALGGPDAISGILAKEIKDKGEVKGPFSGTGLNNQSMNIVIANDAKRKAGQELTPQEEQSEQFARQQLTNGSFVTLPNGNQIYHPGFDLNFINDVQSGAITVNPPTKGNGSIPMSPTVRTEKLDELAKLKASLNSLHKVQTRITDDPTAFGTVGSIRSGAETIAGIASDVTSIVPLPGLEGFFDKLGDFAGPSVQELDPDINNIAYGVARSRKGKGKLNVDDINSAKLDLKTRGVAGSKQVGERFGTVEKQIVTQINTLEKQLGIVTPTATGGFDPELLKFMSPEQRALFGQ